MNNTMIDDKTLVQINGPDKCPSDATPEWLAACEYGLDIPLAQHALSQRREERLEAAPLKVARERPRI